MYDICQVHLRYLDAHHHHQRILFRLMKKKEGAWYDRSRTFRYLVLCQPFLICDRLIFADLTFIP